MTRRSHHVKVFSHWTFGLTHRRVAGDFGPGSSRAVARCPNAIWFRWSRVNYPCGCGLFWCCWSSPANDSSAHWWPTNSWISCSCSRISIRSSNFFRCSFAFCCRSYDSLAGNSFGFSSLFTGQNPWMLLTYFQLLSVWLLRKVIAQDCHTWTGWRCPW